MDMTGPSKRKRKRTDRGTIPLHHDLLTARIINGLTLEQHIEEYRVAKVSGQYATFVLLVSQAAFCFPTCSC